MKKFGKNKVKAVSKETDTFLESLVKNASKNKLKTVDLLLQDTL